MKNEKGIVGIREYVALILLMVGVKLSDDTPVHFFEKMKTTGWMAPIIIAVISLLPILLLVKVMTNYKDKNLHDVNIHLFGKKIGIIVSMVLWLAGSFSIATDSRIYVDTIGTMYFTSTPTLVIYLILMGVCAYGAKKGIQHIGSVAWLLISYVKISLLLTFLLILQQSNINHIFPFWGPGPLETVKEASIKTSIYADFLFLALIAPYIKGPKEYKKGTWIAFAIVSVELTISFLLFLLMFDYVPIQMMNYPYHESLRLLTFGTSLASIETIFFPVWLIATFVRFAAYLYLSAILFGGIFKIKEFEYIIPSLACLFILVGMIPETPSHTIFVLRDWNLTMLTPLFLIFPIILWSVAKLKGEFKHEKSLHKT
ncbi:MAG TPA: GerAB/ArcD/ProY family transporter [Chondromyces sp.]|nr:GerAB/ArcD/ProY family transporter [Chondromyces sp.]